MMRATCFGGGELTIRAMLSSTTTWTSMLIAQAGACRTAVLDKNADSCSVPVSSDAAAAGMVWRGDFGAADGAGNAGGFGGAGGFCGAGADGSGGVGC